MNLKRLIRNGNYFYFRAAPKHTTGVSLNKSSLNLDSVGTTYQLIATIIPSGALEQEVTWSSSDTDIATVDDTGLVTCMALGDCVITVTTVYGGYTDTCDISYTKVTGVSLNKEYIILDNVGETYQLSATITPADAAIQDLVWESSDETIATVSNTGLVTCVSPGICDITVTTVDGGYTATTKVVKSVLIEASYILVGGGGSGGEGGGGGGAVCVYDYSGYGDNFVVTIGSGGAAIACDCGCPGTESSIRCLHQTTQLGARTAPGGCGGCPTQGGNSGSGYIGGYTGGSGTGDGGAGGGAGAGGNGCSSGCCMFSPGGAGGAGICGYGGGGGGGFNYDNGSYTADGGIGVDGGGHGGVGPNTTGSTGWYCCDGQSATNCGGGGGGNGYYTGYARRSASGAGGPGVFIFKYKTACGYNMTGGCKYTSGEYTVHCFTTSGTLKLNYY